MTRRTFLAAAAAATGGISVYHDASKTISVSLGQRETIIDDGQLGLRYFPDEALGIIRVTPDCRVLVAAGVSTYLLAGPSMRGLKVVAKVLEPDPSSSYDNGYVGIGAVAVDARSKTIHAFYHAEDWKDLGHMPTGVHAYFATIAHTVSKDDGRTFQRLGPVITSHVPKQVGGPDNQGCGEMTVLPDKSGRWLFCYYTDHSHFEGRGVGMCMARCALEEYGKAGSWNKYFEGKFQEQGLGGRETPIVKLGAPNRHALSPHVTYSRELEKYVMFFNMVAGEPSGIYVCFSADGVEWSDVVQVIAGPSIPKPDRELMWHPTLIWESEGLSAWLYYSYSPRWGEGDGRKPHYLVGQPVTFRVS